MALIVHVIQHYSIVFGHVCFLFILFIYIIIYIILSYYYIILLYIYIIYIIILKKEREGLMVLSRGRENIAKDEYN